MYDVQISRYIWDSPQSFLTNRNAWFKICGNSYVNNWHTVWIQNQFELYTISVLTFSFGFVLREGHIAICFVVWCRFCKALNRVRVESSHMVVSIGLPDCTNIIFLCWLDIFEGFGLNFNRIQKQVAVVIRI